MKKLTIFFTVLIFLGLTSSNYAQLAKNSWSVGAGLSYPRAINSVSLPGEGYYGAGYIQVQRNFSEHVGLRLKGSFLTLKDRFAISTNTSILGNLDVVYYFVPCEVLSPYFTFGGGFGYSMYDGAVKTVLGKDNDIDYEIALGLGAEYAINNKWKVKAEFGFHNMSNTYFLGADGVTNGGIFGANTAAYMVAELGAIYYFKQGEPSKLCQLYDGISVEVPKASEVDYDRIENMIKKHIPKEVVKEVVVEKPVQVPVPQVQLPKVPVPVPEVKKPNVFEGKKNWVLKGVKFATNSSKIDKSSSAVLDEAVQVLKDNPNLKVEVDGYTDNVGKDAANQKLSEARAVSVKDYFVAKGIAASRLTAVGYGSANPVADNSTPAGRAENRRIELRVVN